MPSITDSLPGLLEEVKKARRDIELIPVQVTLMSKMRSIFRKQEKAFMKELAKHASEFSEAADPNEFDQILINITLTTDDEMAKAIIAAGEGSMSIAADHRLTEFGLEVVFDLKNPRAVKWLSDNAAAKVSDINKTTRKQMATILKKSVEEGTSYAKTAREIKSKWSEFAIGKPQEHIRSRAELVAVTESANAYEEGNLQIAHQLKESGIFMEKYWGNSGDDKVSEGCEDNTGDGWIPVDELHSSGDERPPRFPGCRCFEQYRRREDAL